MNAWLIAAIALLFGFLPCGVAAWKGPPLRGLVAYELTAVMAVTMLVLLSEAFNRTPFYELALLLAVLSLASGLVFVRFLERWI